MLDVDMDLAGRTGIAVRVSDGVMKTRAPACTAYEVV